jgi:hypothetical protein
MVGLGGVELPTRCLGDRNKSPKTRALARDGILCCLSAIGECVKEVQTASGLNHLNQPPVDLGQRGPLSPGTGAPLAG